MNLLFLELPSLIDFFFKKFFEWFSGGTGFYTFDSNRLSTPEKIRHYSGLFHQQPASPHPFIRDDDQKWRRGGPLLCFSYSVFCSFSKTNEATADMNNKRHRLVIPRNMNVMLRRYFFWLLTALVTLSGGHALSQQTDTTFFRNDTTKVRSNQGGSGQEVPDVLKKFVKEYKNTVERDTLAAKEKEAVRQSAALKNLVMDNTLSKMGQDFYEYFYEQWDPPETDRHFTVYIEEKPSPGMGNMVMIKINYDKVFQSRLTPRRDMIEKIAQQAVSRSENYIANYQQIKQQLEGADMKGSGIY
jgi:curli production assembly/transport component CsgE